MTPPVNTPISGAVTVDVELKLPGRTLALNKTEVTHVRSIITESIKSAATHTLTLATPTTDYVDSLIRQAQSQGTPKIRFRVGCGTPGSMAYLPWQDHIITDFAAVLAGSGMAAGHHCRVSSSDFLFTMSRPTRVKAWSGKISAIVAQMAEANGVANTVIEETASEGAWVQSYLDDVDFIRARLLPRAANLKGRGNYNFYVQDNALHFHSPDYQANLRDLAFYQNQALNLTQLDDSQNQLEAGASGVRIIVYNPYAAEIKELAADPALALKFGNVMHQLPQVRGAELNVPYHASTNTVQEAQYLAQSLYESARSQTLGLKLELSQVVLLRVGDIVRIAINPSGSKNTVWSGTYLVTNSVTHIEGGSAMAIFYVKRGEFQTSNLAPTEITVLGENVIVSNVEAPGQPLNLKSLQDSNLVHGAGQAINTSIFVETQDPNKAWS